MRAMTGALRRFPLISATAAILFCTTGWTSAASVDSRVTADLEASGVARVVVVFRSAVRAQAVSAVDAASRGAAVHALLTLEAERTQADVVRVLEARGVPYRVYWVSNAIATTAGRDLVDVLAARPEVALIESDRAFAVPLERAPTVPSTGARPSGPNGVEWGVAKIGAPSVWALGFTGQGLLFGVGDTGVQWDHPALRSNYAGWNGSTADHNYHWWDGVKASVEGHSSSSPVPLDDNGHGTHVTGTAVGDDGGTNQIGVAPGARWIACRNMDHGVGNPSTYLSCLQFFLAPTDLAGNNPDPSRRPHAIANSYTCPASESCDSSSLRDAVENLRAAGVLVVTSIGNSGPTCSSISEPPGLHDAATSVGSTNASDAIANSSGRGPVTADGSGRRKPDLVAPGVSVRSATLGGGYTVLSGTSMAVPHVAGAALLLWSAVPTLWRDVDGTEARLAQTALPLTTTQGCGGDTPTQVPNNTYGYGRVDAAAAVQGMLTPPTLESITPTIGPDAGGTAVTVKGSNFVVGATDLRVNGALAASISVVAPHTLTAVTPAGIAGPASVSVTTSHGTATLTNGFAFVAPALLTVVHAGNGTGTVTSLTPPVAINCGTLCSAAFAYGTAVTLRATPSPGMTFAGWSGGGCSGSGNCVVSVVAPVTVTATFAFPTVFTRYLAEGATSPLFGTRLALLNPGDVATVATLTYLRSARDPIAIQVPVGPRTRVTIDPRDTFGTGTSEFATKVESDQLLIVDRTMTWPVGTEYGAHAETAVRSPAPTWYLAEGATHSGFELFYLLQNPNATDVTVRLRYLRSSGPPLEKQYTLPANSRSNIWVDMEEFDGLGTALAAADVSGVIETTGGESIIVERAMYQDVAGQVFGAGHASAGVTAPAEEWFMAEGATGRYFDLYVLIANPGDTVAEVDATFLLPDGSTIPQRHQVAARSRYTMYVDGLDPRLADTAVSTTIRSANGVPVIAERAMWWPGSAWYEAHNSPGATQTGTLWGVAAGEVDAARDLDTYVLVANTSAFAATVRVTLMFEDGTTATRLFDGTQIPARSRFNVPVGTMFTEAGGRRFGALVESLGDEPAQIVVEGAMYWDAAGQQWAAGTNALATRLR
jgi:hypothetical protein